ncbi:MAG: amidohydrolase family protein [Syntrophales bacterium]
MPSYFIDCHCHLFTIADIPIYRSIYQFIEKNDKLHKRILFPFAGLILPLLDLKGTAEKYEKFFRFFENEPNTNVSRLSTEIDQFVNAEGSPYADRTILLTPLVMDFDINGEVNKLATQVQRLTNAIKAGGFDSSRIKILPFLGVDPRWSDALARIDRYESLKNRIPPASLNNGDFVGIKLYPPLGFDVEKHPDFYRALCARQLPVTVHCQKDSFRLTGSADAYTDPANWEKIFADSGTQNLRINFAHFGGEDSVVETVKFKEKGPNEEGILWSYEGIDEDTWTYRIIRLLKKYPNTYSDVAAFDAKNVRAVAALIWLLQLDMEGEFNKEGGFSLADKLLWGTDYPMVLGDMDTNYTTIFNGFANALKRKEHDYYQYPKPLGIDAAALLEKMVCANPKKFLNV